MSDLSARTTLLSAAAATGAGTGFSLGRPMFVNSVQLIITGAPTRVVVTIEGLINGTTWDELATLDTNDGLATDDIVGVSSYPVMSVRANIVTLTGGTAPTVTVYAVVSDQPASGGSSGGVGGGATASSGALTARSIASLAGTSESLVAANASRKYLFISNPGATNIGVHLTGGTAAIGVGGTHTITPGGSLVFEGSFIPTNAFTVIGTAAQPLTCVEG